jgi:hypothetical protein
VAKADSWFASMPHARNGFLKTNAAQLMEMKGRPVRGWLHIDGDHVHSQHQLAEWMALGTTAATSTLGKPS